MRLIRIQLSVGTMPHDEMMRAIELLGTRVAPVVRREPAAPTPPAHHVHAAGAVHQPEGTGNGEQRR